MAFATAEDIEKRLGRPLSDAQREQAEALIADAGAVILAELNLPEGCEVEPDELLCGMTCTLVMRAMANPQGLASESETLGAHSHSRGFSRNGGGLTLTENEKLILRRHKYKRLSGTSRPESVVEEMYDYLYGDGS